MINYILNNFVRQISGGNIQIYDKHDINHININVFLLLKNYIIDNIIRLELSDNNIYILTFESNNTAIMALSKLQVEIDLAKLNVGSSGIKNINAQLPLIYSS